MDKCTTINLKDWQSIALTPPHLLQPTCISLPLLQQAFVSPLHIMQLFAVELGFHLLLTHNVTVPSFLPPCRYLVLPPLSFARVSLQSAVHVNKSTHA